jgi:hypothetical protein
MTNSRQHLSFLANDDSWSLDWSAWNGRGSRQQYLHALTWDGAYVYIGLYHWIPQPGQVVKIDPATMTTILTWTGTYKQNSYQTLALDCSYLYCGLYNPTPTKIVKVDPATMTTIMTWVGTSNDAPRGLLYAGTSLYAGIFASPAQVFKINAVTMATIDNWVGASGQDFTSDQGLAFDGTSLYTSLATYPAQVCKIDPAAAPAKPAQGSIASRLLSAGVL